jgi:hypothetical protein
MCHSPSSDGGQRLAVWPNPAINFVEHRIERGESSSATVNAPLPGGPMIGTVSGGRPTMAEGVGQDSCR